MSKNGVQKKDISLLMTKQKGYGFSFAFDVVMTCAWAFCIDTHFPHLY